MRNSAESVLCDPISNPEENADDEQVLRSASSERQQTLPRVHGGINGSIAGELSEIQATRLGHEEPNLPLNRIADANDYDAGEILNSLRQRLDAADRKLPKIEVRFQNLNVAAYVHVGSRALPTIPNFFLNTTEAFLRQLRIFVGGRKRLQILDNVYGIIRPSRMTLLLGPPSSGKTTLLLALAGQLPPDLQASGSITYNGHSLKEFVPQRTSAYVSQQDSHIAEMTVREILKFAGRCQDTGNHYDVLLELSLREKNSSIKTDEDLDGYMKALAMEEESASLVADHVLKVLGLDVCADSLVGDEFIKGISGGQKKRLTTGELLVGPARVLFMDEISTGLDSSTTYHMIKYLRYSSRACDQTIMISLLQPDPETYELFDDVVLMCEGYIVFQGPRDSALDFFSFMGFRCPERKNIADFLQEVISKNDQAQYWSVSNTPYEYVTAAMFAEAFGSFHLGRSLSVELATRKNWQNNPPAALVSDTYGIKRADLLRACFSWQMVLMKRNLFIYIFKFIQLLFVAVVCMTVFFRTAMHHDTVDGGIVYLGALYFSVIMILFNGFTEVSMLITKLPVLYKHRNLHFYPCWAYTLPSWILSIPVSLAESGIWVVVTYYLIGFDPQITRCLRQFLLFFFLHQMSLSLFRMIASLGRNMIVANTFGSFAMLVVMVLGGFIVSRGHICPYLYFSLKKCMIMSVVVLLYSNLVCCCCHFPLESVPKWWIWGYWFSPLMYAQNAASVNEFLAPSWAKKAGNHSSSTFGEAVLKAHGLFLGTYWYWIGIAALFGYTVLFNILFTFFLSSLNPLEKKQAVVSEKMLTAEERIMKDIGPRVEPRSQIYPSDLTGKNSRGHKGMVLPFQPLYMCFTDINYSVDVPIELKKQGIFENRLQLLTNITGVFRPGVLTALLGISGAGKTTLMDVLAGRKTGGFTEGSITISGYPRNQETFARVSGYCEQNDIHSPCLTVRESLLYSAWLRLAEHIEVETKWAFVEEVMELVELTHVSSALVGLPGIDGLSMEQRKRLTIAVELVANPSIVFMDEPTSGLDARSAAIVMRAVRNIADTARTIVCTIHQPSIDVFESFDELMVMKRGGQLIYSGPLGPKSRNLVQFFESITGIPKIKPGRNPAVWLLEITSPAEEDCLGIDFAEIYQQSDLCQQNKKLVEGLNKPFENAKDLHFPTKYSQPLSVQLLACLWKHNLSYWRNPHYTAVRFFYTIIVSVMFGTICWRFGTKRRKQQDLLDAMGSLYAAVLFLGVTNATAVQPVIAMERFVSYRERAAGMYSALAFALSLVVVELPYIFIQTLIYGSVYYSMASFQWELVKIFLYMFFMFFTLLYFTLFGMMITALTPNHSVAPVIAAPFYMLWNLFSGLMITHKALPVWCRWYYWANPIAWTLYGLLTSQYGDVKEMIELVDGSKVNLSMYLKDNFGFHHYFLGMAGFVVVCFSLIFATVFGFAIKCLNFQKR